MIQTTRPMKSSLTFFLALIQSLSAEEKDGTKSINRSEWIVRGDEGSEGSEGL